MDFNEWSLDLTEQLANEIRKKVRVNFRQEWHPSFSYNSSPSFGNISLNLFEIAKKSGTKPLVFAEKLKIYLAEFTEKKKIFVDDKKPGFLNFYFSQKYYYWLIWEIIKQGKTFLRANANGQKVNVEYVSANPTGFLHVGHARNAVVGNTIFRILDYAGYEVTGEYYLNDSGVQVHNLGTSVQKFCMAKLNGKDLLLVKLSDDEYRGPGIKLIADDLVKKYGSELEKKNVDFFKKEAIELATKYIQNHLKKLNVKFDIFTSENSVLIETKRRSNFLQKLASQKLTYKKDGALWFRSKDYGDSKDRVLQKSNGEYTYFATDICYHDLKVKRGYNRLINVWGSDHHGYIPRLEAFFKSQNYPPLEIKTIQMVKVLYEGKEVRMSKRAGNAITLDYLLSKLDLDAIRFSMLSKTLNTSLELSINDLLLKDKNNRIYYIQYAYARCKQLLRKAGDSFLKLNVEIERFNEHEMILVRKLDEYQAVIKRVINNLELHQLANYLYQLATAFHAFYNSSQIINQEEPQRTNLRLAIIKAVQEIISLALNLMGIEPRSRM